MWAIQAPKKMPVNLSDLCCRSYSAIRCLAAATSSSHLLTTGGSIANNHHSLIYSGVNISGSVFHGRTVSSKKVLTLNSMNPRVKKMEYAVRGPIVQRAVQIQDELDAGAKKPFSEIVRANIGDCHATGQEPLTYIRQVLALCTFPDLMSDSRFPEDTKQKAARILGSCGGHSMGAYTESGGIRVVRQDIATYIANRDGYDSKWENITLTTGASEGIKSILELLNSTGENGELTGVMVPIPQYPLYSATLAEYNMHQIGYYLDEADQWSLNAEELQRSLESAKCRYSSIAAWLCLILIDNCSLI